MTGCKYWSQRHRENAVDDGIVVQYWMETNLAVPGTVVKLFRLLGWAKFVCTEFLDWQRSLGERRRVVKVIMI